MNFNFGTSSFMITAAQLPANNEKMCCEDTEFPIYCVCLFGFT
jgi:hypothetical protein